MQRRHIKLNCLKSCGLSEKLDNGMMERRYEVNWREGSEMSLGWGGFVGGGEEALWIHQGTWTVNQTPKCEENMAGTQTRCHRGFRLRVYWSCWIRIQQHFIEAINPEVQIVQWFFAIMHRPNFYCSKRRENQKHRKTHKNAEIDLELCEHSKTGHESCIIARHHYKSSCWS